MNGKYGDLPQDMGRIDISVPEVLYYLYLPVSLAGSYQHPADDHLA